MTVCGVCMPEVFLQFDICVLGQVQIPDPLIIAEERIADGYQFDIRQCSTGKGKPATLTAAENSDPVLIDAVHTGNDLIQQCGIQKNITEQEIIRVLAFQSADDMTVMRIPDDPAHILAFSALSAHVQCGHGKPGCTELHESCPVAGTACIPMKLENSRNRFADSFGHDPFRIHTRALGSCEIQVIAVEGGMRVGKLQGDFRIQRVHFFQCPVPVCVKVRRPGVGSLILPQLFY